ncbi:unnamed protein product [Prorocentrum cordatum]|uniref:Uncharacterized protein n=1 Tax=Prorocentrum cordatum TaxID=2364126 RepID=A0ABN9UTP1_9DINO|nr:unnamed protein product [Polarella glacialis]
MLARPGYAALSAAYRLAESAWGKRTALHREVKQEMRIVVGLAWLTEANLAAPYVPGVHASDSADLGHGLMNKRARADELRTANRWKEKWSFPAASSRPSRRPGLSLGCCRHGGGLRPDRPPLRASSFKHERQRGWAPMSSLLALQRRWPSNRLRPVDAGQGGGRLTVSWPSSSPTSSRPTPCQWLCR